MQRGVNALIILIVICTGKVVPVDNTSCVVYDWENMTCMWNLQKIFHQGGNGSVSDRSKLTSQGPIDFTAEDYHVTLEWAVYVLFA